MVTNFVYAMTSMTQLHTGYNLLKAYMLYPTAASCGVYENLIKELNGYANVRKSRILELVLAVDVFYCDFRASLEGWFHLDGCSGCGW